MLTGAFCPRDDKLIRELAIEIEDLKKQVEAKEALLKFAEDREIAAEEREQKWREQNARLKAHHEGFFEGVMKTLMALRVAGHEV